MSIVQQIFGTGAKAPITEEERRRREAAVRFADASIGIEGLQVSREGQERARRFIAGEIDLETFLRKG
jgi:hypothetical protein